MIRQLVHDPTLLSGPFSWIGPLKVSPLSLYIYIYIYIYVCIFKWAWPAKIIDQAESFPLDSVDGANIIWTNTPNISGVSSLLFEKSLLVRFGSFFFFFFCKIEDLVVLWFLILLFYEQTVKECRIWEAQGTPLAN